MTNLSKQKTKCFIRTPDERISDFSEIILGYTKEEAINEASRCLNCKNPTCIKGCPAGNNIPLFIKHIKEGNVDEAYKVLRLTSNMPEICSRVCDYSKQCEGSCIRAKNGEAVAIGLLERYVCDSKSIKISAEPQYLGKKVAIIGSGPAGLSCAEELNSLGYDVTVFEQEEQFGGLLTYGIPNYRLPFEIVNNKILDLKNKNIHFVNNSKFGKDLTFQSLKYAGFAAIFVGIGVSAPKFMGINGENLKGVYTSNNFLKSVSNSSKKISYCDNDFSLGKRVAVVGGGNSAIDAARTALRIRGVETVEIIYRRTKDDMPAALSEIEDAINEGVVLNTLVNPIEIIGENNCVKAVKCIKMEQIERGSDGRRKVKPIDNSEFTKLFDSIIYAIGNDSDDILNNFSEVEVNKWGNIIVDEHNSSSKDPSIFAAGDVVSGPATVVQAMANGKKTANFIDQFLKNI